MAGGIRPGKQPDSAVCGFSNTDTIEVGLNACDNRAGRTMLNSASLERLGALDLVRKIQQRGDHYGRG